METGKLKKVPIHTVFMTFYGLLTFPLLAKNLLTHIFLNDEADFPALMIEWKQYIIFHMTNLLYHDKEG